MASLNCKRFIVTSMYGDAPVMTDDEAVIKHYVDSDEHFVLDTVDGTYLDGVVWIKMKEPS